jgi:hypothetical protein
MLELLIVVPLKPINTDNEDGWCIEIGDIKNDSHTKALYGREPFSREIRRNGYKIDLNRRDFRRV